MKVCLISSFYPPLTLGGADVYAKRVSDKLSQNGIQVVVITTNSKISFKPSIEKMKNLKIYRIHPLNIYAICNTFSKPGFLKPLWYAIDLLNLHSHIIIKNIIKTEKPDLVHIHNFKGFSFSFNTVKRLDLPLIFTAHDYFIGCLKENFFRKSCEVCNKRPILCQSYVRIQRFLKGDRPDVVTAPSQFVIDKLKEDSFFNTIKTMKLPLAIEIDSIQKIEKDFDIIDLLFVGRLNRFKGLHVLIGAFNRIKHKNICLHIVGEGLDMERFKKIAGGNPNIKFYGFIQDEELIELYKKANVVVVPSIWFEVFGLIIVESFKYSTPVIGSNIGGIPELIENGYNGYLFETGNEVELKEIIENLIENPKELKRLSDNAFRSASKYGMDEHISKLVRLYESVIEKQV